MDTSQAAVDSKQGDATTNEHTPAAVNEGTEQQEVTEGQSSVTLGRSVLVRTDVCYNV